MCVKNIAFQQVSQDLRALQAEMLTSRLAEPGGVLTSEGRKAGAC
jgi:hypothetical protein